MWLVIMYNPVTRKTKLHGDLALTKLSQVMMRCDESESLCYTEWIRAKLILHRIHDMTLL